MDDGFQSARIHMDYALLVVDARRGVGNGHVIPGGPLRAPLVDQLRFAEAVLKMGEGDGRRRRSCAGRRAPASPVFEAHTEPRDPDGFAGRRFLAFAGIGDPDKFFDTRAQRPAATVAMRRAFPDHHFYPRGRS